MIDIRSLLTEVLGRLLACTDADDTLASDRRAAWDAFRGTRTPNEDMEARFAEWYLFERRSPHLGDLPAFVALSERVAPQLSPEARDLLDELAASLYGAFEPIEADSKTSDVLRDVLTGRRVALEGSVPATLGADGALIVGRLFATGRGSYLASPAAVAATGPLAAALRSDLVRVVEEGHGKLSQREIEVLLFSNTETLEPEPLERVEADVDRWLVEAAVPGVDLATVREWMESAEAVGEIVGPILERAAFESEADLEAGRRLLPAYFAALRARRAKGRPAAKGAAPEGAPRAAAASACPCGSGSTYGECCLRRDALARFDAGRARGEDLTALFRSLEAAMDLEIDDTEVEEGLTDLEPVEVLGALVLEFAWERERLEQPLDAAERAALEGLARSIDHGGGAPADASEVRVEHLERYFSWERYGADTAPASGQLESEVAVVRRFALWLAEEQDSDWTSFLEPLAERILEDAPRIARANALLGSWKGTEGPRTAYRIASVADGGETLLEPLVAGRAALRMGVHPELARHLRPDDCVYLRAPEPAPAKDGAIGAARLERILPPGARAFLGGRLADEASSEGREARG